MRWPVLALLWFLVLGSAANAAEGRVLKVLPQFLDLKGRTSISPSLFDRDAYQARLRRNPALRSGLLFKIQWKASVPKNEELKLRVEVRGIAKGDLPKESSLETKVQQVHWFSHWTGLKLDEKAYQEFGEVTAWRVTLWDGKKLLSEQKSFLW